MLTITGQEQSTLRPKYTCVEVRGGHSEPRFIKVAITDHVFEQSLHIFYTLINNIRPIIEGIYIK